MGKQSNQRLALVLLFAALLAPGRGGTEAASPPHSIVDALRSARTVMFVGAHADDENSASGFLARSSGAGHRTVIVCFTRGENEPMDVGVAKGRAMGEARARWLLDAAAVLGVQEVVQLDYTDGPLTLEEIERGGIRYWPRDTAMEQVLAQWRRIGRDPYEDMVRVIRKVRPDLIVTWEKTKGWTGNSEHRLIGLLAERAFDDAADPAVFPDQLTAEHLAPWQAGYLFWVLAGEQDGVGPHPVETVGCDVPGPSGLSACEAKVMAGLTYSKNWGRKIPARQRRAMLVHASQLEEHYQLARVREDTGRRK